MSTEELPHTPIRNFFRKNVEFLGFIGGWDCYVGIDTVHTLFYLIRTKDRDWLEAVVKYSNRIISRSCVMSIARHGSKREAAARLVDAHVRSGFTTSARFRHTSRGCYQMANWKALSERLPRS